MNTIEGEYSLERVYKYATKIVAAKTKNSNVLSVNIVDNITKCKLDGHGGLSVVQEISSFDFQDENDIEVNHDYSYGALSSMTKPCRRHKENFGYGTDCTRKSSNEQTKYAIKRVDETSYTDVNHLLNGIVDLAIEAKYLSVVHHPNIIQLRAIADCSPYDISFFVVLEQMQDTLYTRLINWKMHKIPTIKRVLTDRKRIKECCFWRERVTYAYGLASALKYLHQLNIMHRDIKPENIGFSFNGEIKLFDFGLAREVDTTSQRDADGLYKLTAEAGSPRYMDPRVALGQTYDERCDVYSFCVVAWELFELQTPYDGIKYTALIEKVFEGYTRPKINHAWSPELQQMMHSGFGDISKRSSMTSICDALQAEINFLEYKTTEINITNNHRHNQKINHLPINHLMLINRNRLLQ